VLRNARAHACRPVRRIAIKIVETTYLPAGQNGDHQARKETSCGKRRRRRSSASGRASSHTQIEFFLKIYPENMIVLEQHCI